MSITPVYLLSKTLNYTDYAGLPGINITRNQETARAASLQLIAVGTRHVQSPRLSFRRCRNQYHILLAVSIPKM